MKRSAMMRSEFGTIPEQRRIAIALHRIRDTAPDVTLRWPRSGPRRMWPRRWGRHPSRLASLILSVASSLALRNSRSFDRVSLVWGRLPIWVLNTVSPRNPYNSAALWLLLYSRQKESPWQSFYSSFGLRLSFLQPFWEIMQPVSVRKVYVLLVWKLNARRAYDNRPMTEVHNHNLSELRAKRAITISKKAGDSLDLDFPSFSSSSLNKNDC